MNSNGCVMRSAGPAVTRNGLSPEMLIMNNNNYLPGNTPFNSMNSMAGAGGAQTAGHNLSSLHSRQGGSDSFYQQYCNSTQWSGINSSAVIGNPNCQDYNIGTKQCEHQGSIVPSNEYSDNQLPAISLNSSVGYSVTQNFTFTSPTQSSLQSSVLVSCTPPRFHGARTVSHTFAPTGFTQWQHSVPHRIPWSTVGMTTQPGLSVFTGSSTMCRPLQSCVSSQPAWTTPSSHMKGPVASCSEEPRRPKRHSSENTECLAPSNKIHITEEKFAKHMEELSINCMAATDNARIQNTNTAIPIAGLPHLTSEQQRRLKFPGSPLPVNCNSDNDFARQWADYMSVPKNNNKNWKTFQDLEDSLDVSDEEGEKIRETQPTLHLVQDVPKLVPRPDIIPKNILNEIQRPRMELMVWTPPGEALSKVVALGQTADMGNSNTQAADTNYITTSQSFSGSEAMLEDDDCMDIEPSDDLDL